MVLGAGLLPSSSLTPSSTHSAKERKKKPQTSLPICQRKLLELGVLEPFLCISSLKPPSHKIVQDCQGKPFFLFLNSSVAWLPIPKLGVIPLAQSLSQLCSTQESLVPTKHFLFCTCLQNSTPNVLPKCRGPTNSWFPYKPSFELLSLSESLCY